MLNNDDRESIAPDLKAMLDEIRSTPPRDEEVAAKGKAHFMSEVDSLFGGQSKTARPTFGQRMVEKIGVLKLGLGSRAALTTLLVAIAILVLLFSGAGMTAYASQAALPGDALYSVKTGLEDTRANLTRDAANQVVLHLHFAQLRMDEIENLIAEGRYDDIRLATKQFEQQIQSALMALARVSVSNPTRAVELTNEITKELSRYAQALSNMASGAPEAVRQELEKAAQVSQNSGLMGIKKDGEIEFMGLIEQIIGEGLVVNGQTIRITAQTELKTRLEVGMLVIVHAMRSSSGEFTAREVDLVQPAQGNESGNGNLNGNNDDRHGSNVNANLNGNQNENINGEDRDNLNDNQDRSVNENTGNDQNEESGADHNDNINTNDDHSGGGHDNENTNDNENNNDHENNNDNEGEDDNENKSGFFSEQVTIV